MLRMDRTLDFSKIGDAIEPPDLIQIQTTSYKRFLQDIPDPERRKDEGLEALLREVFPIVSYDGNNRLEYVSYELGEPRYTSEECRELRLTYGKPFRVRCRLIRKDRKDVVEESIYLGEMPIMIGGGEFIINGAERVIVSQLHRSPGVDFTVEVQESDRPLHGARIIPNRGSWIEMAVTKKDVLAIRIDQSAKFPVTSFLRAMDEVYGSSDAILREFYETEKMEPAQLKPHMYSVGPIIDPESGEELVPAGGQIGDAVTRIQILGARPRPSTPAQANKRKAQLVKELLKNYKELRKRWLGENLEFTWSTVPQSFGEDELSELEACLISKYAPALNRKGEAGASDASPNEKVEKAFNKCVAIIEKVDAKWALSKDDLKTRKPDPQGKRGVYFFRDRESKSVADGYIGKSGDLAKRLGMHLSGGVSGDNMLKRCAEQEGAQIVAAEQSLGIEGMLEVVVKPSDTLMLNTIAEDQAHTHEEALLRIYTRLRPGNPPQLDKAKTLFAEKFYDENRYRLGRVGRFRLNRKFHQEVPEQAMTLRVEDMINCLKYILQLRAGKGVVDDIDHLGNRRLRTIDELGADELRKGFLKLRRTVQERMSLKDPEELTKIAELVNSKSVSSSIDYFFGRSELSQVVDQTNPLAQMTHERRLSALGPGGLNRKRAGFEVRDVHISHYGRICPIETPEGNNIGLISSLSLYATVDEYGFVVTAYRRVRRGRVTNEIAWLRADEEMESVLAPPDVLERDETGRATNRLRDSTVLARRAGEVGVVESVDVEYLDVSPKQTVGVSAALIPFLEHDDANRALMGSNMQRQAVPLIITEPPIVATGLERIVAENSGMVVRARKGGTVTYVDSQRIVIDGVDEYELRKFARLNERTCLNQKPIVRIGQRVHKNQVLADGPACSQGELALGRNVLTAFVPFDGYNFEDAILISERLVKNDSFTSIHIEQYEVEIRETKLGREEFTRDIPNVSERSLRDLDENGVVRLGTHVQPKDILVGKVAPKSKSELTPEEKLLHAIFGRAGEDVKNDSLELPAGEEGVVIAAKRFSRRVQMSDEQKRALSKEIRLYRAKMDAKARKVFRTMCEEINNVLGVPMVDPSTRQKVGMSDIDEVVDEQIENFKTRWIKSSKPADRERGERIYERYGPLIENILHEKERKMGHMKRGDELPSGVLEMVKVYVATRRRLAVGDKMAGRHGNKGVIARIMSEEDMPFLEDGTPVDLCLNPLGVPSRMNVGQILETHLGWAAAVLGFKAITPVFDGASEQEIFDAIAQANEHVQARRQDVQVVQQAGETRELLAEMPTDGKVVVYDGRTGEPFEQKVTVGFMYMTKLHHLVDEKIHARSTGPYSLITQQPLGGKARTGGQRFGEMEVWALEAYGASYTLQEMLTVKSDDVEGRTKIYESMVKGSNTLEAGTPVSFDVLCSELRGLGLNIQLEKKSLI